jgi:beta-ribofuranosylaminobenzene 5'-phosphate synthase
LTASTSTNDASTVQGTAVRVSSPARLSFTLISLDGESRRRNGIASIGAERPNATVTATATPGRATTVVGAEEETHHALVDGLAKLQRIWDGPDVALDVQSSLPAHSGFGSKTTTLIAAGYAYGLLSGQTPDIRWLSATLGRGRTSGASTGLAEHGGFLVDCGHLNPPDFAAEPTKYLRPSHFATEVQPPTPVIKMDFPDWPILILQVNGRNIGGPEELEWFTTTMPIPPAESWRTSHLVFMGLAPAVAERDYDTFCSVVNELTFTGYFKRAQIALQGQEMVDLLDEGRSQSSVDAIAMSSHGPTCFAFCRDTEAAAAWAEGLRQRGVIRAHWFTTVRNSGLAATWL